MPDSLNLDRVFQTILFDRQRDGTEGSASTIKRLSREDVVILCRDRQCQDKRDVIYGTLSIIDWTALEVYLPDGTWMTDEAENMAITPDCSVSKYDLARTVLPRLQSTTSILYLCDALQLSPKDMEIMDEIAKRKATDSLSTWSLLSEQWTPSRIPQMLTHVHLKPYACNYARL